MGLPEFSFIIWIEKEPHASHEGKMNEDKESLRKLTVYFQKQVWYSGKNRNYD